MVGCVYCLLFVGANSFDQLRNRLIILYLCVCVCRFSIQHNCVAFILVYIHIRVHFAWSGDAPYTSSDAAGEQEGLQSNGERVENMNLYQRVFQMNGVFKCGPHLARKAMHYFRRTAFLSDCYRVTFA